MKPEIEAKLGTTSIPARLRRPETAMIAKVESALVQGAVQYCEGHGYQLILIPHLTRATGACENFSTLFATELFGTTVYLNQTGQLMLEAFMDTTGKTYCYGPSFRKEDVADPRHLIEFPLFEIEVANCPLPKLREEISNIIGSMLSNAEEKSSAELAHLVGSPDLSWLKPPYAAMTYEEAISHLAKYNLMFGDDLKADHEQYLVDQARGPVFVTHYPQEIKFFNMRVNRENPAVVNSMDLLLPFSGEAVGSAEREEDYTLLTDRLGKSDMLRLLKESIRREPGHQHLGGQALDAEAMGRFSWYLDIIKRNPVPHAGCGIGVNRVTQAVLQTHDIRHATAFPMNRQTLF